MRLLLVSLVWFSLVAPAWSQGENTKADDSKLFSNEEVLTILETTIKNAMAAIASQKASLKAELYTDFKKFYENHKELTKIDPTYQGIGEVVQEIEKGKQALSFLENVSREAEMAIKQSKADLGEPFVPITLDTATEYGKEYSNKCDPAPKSYSYYRFCYSLAMLMRSDTLLFDWNKDLFNFYEAFFNIYREAVEEQKGLAD